MNTTSSADVVAIASHVCSVLEAFGPDPAGFLPAELASSGAGEAVTFEELTAIVDRLVSELARLQWAQQHLEQQLLALSQQFEVLPACIMRLEQWTGETEQRLEKLSHSQDVGGAAPVTREQNQQGEAVPTILATRQWHSIKEVAAQLHVSESTVRRYIRQGKLPAVRLPGGRGLRLPGPELPEDRSSVGDTVDEHE